MAPLLDTPSGTMELPRTRSESGEGGVEMGTALVGRSPIPVNRIWMQAKDRSRVCISA